MKSTFFFLFSALLVLSSCADAKKPIQLEAVDSMLVSVDSIAQIVLENKIDSSLQYSNQAEDVERRIKRFYFTDTINEAFARKMDAFKVMRRKFKPLTMDQLTLDKGCVDMKESLKKLRSDIENSYNERDKYDEFIGFEQAKLEQLQILSADYVDTKNKTILTFHDLYDELNAFSMMLVEKAKGRK
jgi:hypothetical protein